jgi:hypothetical protein
LGALDDYFDARGFTRDQLACPFGAVNSGPALRAPLNLYAMNRLNTVLTQSLR